MSEKKEKKPKKDKILKKEVVKKTTKSVRRDKKSEKQTEKKTVKMPEKTEVLKTEVATVSSEKPVKASQQILPKKKISVYQAVGRRKTATAFATLTIDPQKKEKTFLVNGHPIEQYFPISFQKKFYLEPLRTTNTINRFDISVKVSGSGPTGQLGAVIHAVSRALTKVDPERFPKILRKRGFLTRDPRAKERKKVGLMGARHEKQSPRR